MLIWGIKPVTEALRTAKSPIEKLYLCSDRKSPPPVALERFATEHPNQASFVSIGEMDRLSHRGNHQGAAAEIGEFPYLTWDEMEADLAADERGCALLLDGITDPQNLGNLARSAAALGMRRVIIPEDASARVTDTVARTSSGGVFHLDICLVKNLVKAGLALREHGYLLLGLDAAGEDVRSVEIQARVAAVVGSEGKGIRRMMKKACDALVRIPTSREFPQLNAATAGALFMYEVMRRSGPA